VGIKRGALPTLVSGVTPRLLPHMPHLSVRKTARVRFDLFSSFPILSSFGLNFVFHNPGPELQHLYQFFVTAGDDWSHNIGTGYSRVSCLGMLREGERKKIRSII